MKKIIFLILTLVCINCSHTSESNKTIESKSKEVYRSGKIEKADLSCDINDILLLRNEKLQVSFFLKLDSTLNIQYPEIKEKQSVDINLDLLNKFMNDLNMSEFENSSTYEKEYKYKLVPKDVKVIKDYLNKIELGYNKENCDYRLLLINYYETTDYSDEGSVVYIFKIINNEIMNFKRQEAG